MAKSAEMNSVQLFDTIYRRLTVREALKDASETSRSHSSWEFGEIGFVASSVQPPTFQREN
jgi:hypothetical protein